MSHTYDYPRPALTVDVVLFSGDYVLLIQRGKEPFKDCWALPGGFVNENESPEAAARRELLEETTVLAAEGTLTQVGAFGDPGRDPRGWTMSVAFTAESASLTPKVVGRDDAAAAEWWFLGDLPPLAFDHKNIIDAALGAAERKR